MDDAPVLLRGRSTCRVMRRTCEYSWCEESVLQESLTEVVSIQWDRCQALSALVLLHARRAILLTLGWGLRTLKGKRSFACRSTTVASEGSRGDHRDNGLTLKQALQVFNHWEWLNTCYR